MRCFVLLLSVVSAALLCDAAPLADTLWPVVNPVAPFQAVTNTGFEVGKGVVATGLNSLQAGANMGFNTLAALAQFLNPLNFLQAGAQSFGLGPFLSGLTGGQGASVNGVATGLNGLTNGLPNGLNVDGTALNGVTNGLTGVVTSTFGTGLNGLTNGVATTLNGVTNGAATALNGLTNGVATGLNGVTNGVASTVNGLGTTLNGLSYGVASTLNGGGTGLLNGVTGALTDSATNTADN